MENKDKREDLDIDKRKNKERPALQIYKPGMRRLSSQTNPQGNSSRNDEEEKCKTSETKSMESPDEGSYKEHGYSNKQKDRSNRGHRNDQGNENSGYKRQDKYERHQKSKGSDNLEHRGADQGKKSTDIYRERRIVSRNLILNLIINKIIKKGRLTLEMMMLNNVVRSMKEDSMVAKTKRMAEEGFISNL